jgi:hypothetical protein
LGNGFNGLIEPILIPSVKVNSLTYFASCSTKHDKFEISAVLPPKRRRGSTSGGWRYDHAVFKSGGGGGGYGSTGLEYGDAE